MDIEKNNWLTLYIEMFAVPWSAVVLPEDNAKLCVHITVADGWNQESVAVRDRCLAKALASTSSRAPRNVTKASLSERGPRVQTNGNS